MNKAKVMRKAEAGEGLTVAEIKVYQKTVKPEKQVYGKYGTLAKLYLEDNVALIDEPSTEVTEEPKTYTAQDILKMAGISLAVGVVIALIVCLIMKSCMKTARPKHTANDYIKKNSFHITRSRDIFIYAELSKRKRVKEESKK